MELLQDDVSHDKDLHMKILSPAVLYIQDRFGEKKFEEIAQKSVFTAAALRKCNGWMSQDQFEAFCRLIFDFLGQDEKAYQDAFGHKMLDAYGPVLWVSKATTPKQIFKYAIKKTPNFSKISNLVVQSMGRTWLHVRYISKKEESRLACLARIALIKKLTSMWGLPASSFRETACLGWGDAYCEYHVKWREVPDWTWPVAILSAGLVCSGALAYLQLTSFYTPFSILVIGALLLYVRAQSRIIQKSNKDDTELRDAIERMQNNEDESMQEILRLHQRQQVWSEELERRSRSIHRIVDNLAEMNDDRRDLLAGFSHDLRNSVAVLRSIQASMKGHSSGIGEEILRLTEEQSQTVARMDVLINEMMETAVADIPAIRQHPEKLETAHMATSLQRRLGALCLGKDIAIQVVEKELPSHFYVDHLIFNRVIDNLFTNAAKYTDEGSVTVELDSTDDRFVVAVSDTGAGMGQEQIDNILNGSKVEVKGEPGHRFGLGLSVVCQLVRDVGGDFDIVSKHGRGTRFLVSFPLQPNQR